MSENSKVVIVGGGYAGVEAALQLSKAFRKDPSVDITLIDKRPYHTLMTELHELAGGRVNSGAVRIFFDRIFPEGRVNVVMDEVRRIDFQDQVVTSAERHYEYDYLILATGGEPETFNLPGVSEHSHFLWSLDDAIKLRDHIKDMYWRAAHERDPEKRKQYLTFVVAGAGFTGVEMVGELLEWRSQLCKQYDIPESEVRIVLVEALDTILPILPEKLQKKSARYLEKKGVEIMIKSALSECREDEVLFGDGRSIATRTVVWTCGVMGSEFAANLDLTKGRCTNPHCQIAQSKGTCGLRWCQYVSEFAIETRYVNGKRGRLLTNEYMQSVDFANVYVVGDNAYYVEEAEEFKKSRPIPQIVETALQTAECAVQNIVADMKGEKKEPFESNFHGHMVSIGSRYAVAHVMGISLSGFLAMLTKHMIHLHYLWGVAGFNGVTGYIKEQFFDIPDRRSIVGGLASAKIKAFWLVPLRLWLGGKWLYEGVSKIVDGWLNPENIWILPVEATASATPGDEAYATVEPLLSEPLGIYEWMLDTFITRAPFLFQASVVIGETALGLALIAGLFTFLGGIGSLMFCIMFTMSGMAGSEILWYFFATIAIMGGAGRTLGLDYWVMPWLKRWWRHVPFARRTHLYLE